MVFTHPASGRFVTGPGAPANGLDYSNLNNYSLKAYQGNSFTGIGNTLTTNLSGTNLSAANTGYFMFVRGDRSRTPIDNTVYPNTNITTLSSRGKLQTGTQLFDVTNASIPTPSFSLVGNPYASSVDFNLITKINVNPNRFYISGSTYQPGRRVCGNGG